MFLLQKRLQMLLVEAVRVLEMCPHVRAKRLVPLRYLIKQVSYGNNLTELKGILLLDHKHVDGLCGEFQVILNESDFDIFLSPPEE